MARETKAAHNPEAVLFDAFSSPEPVSTSLENALYLLPVADRLDVVPVGIEHERAIVILVILRAQPRLPVVPPTG